MKISTTRFHATALFGLLLAAAPAPAQEPPSTPTSPSIQELATAFQAEHGVPGLMVGVITPQGDTLMSYGVASTTGDVALDGRTRFEVGSLSKVFTGLLLADMVTRDEVALDDPLSRHLPAAVSPPVHAGTEPTLRQLSAHTSGLPRLPGNFAPEDMSDPYANYTADAMYDFLSGYQIPRAPGSEYEYSNLAVGLLGELLATRASTPYGTLLADRIVEPLGLAGTYVPEGSAVDERMAQGHANGEVVSYWRMGALQGAGEVRSTVEDMMRFLHLQIDPDGSPLADAVRLSQESAPVMENLSMGLGWHSASLPDDVRLYWHNGGTGGFRSFAAFAPDHHVGIVVLANAAMPLQAIDQLGMQMIMAAMGTP